MDKVREARLRWYGYVQQREDDDCDKQILVTDVHRKWIRGRQRKNWINVIKYDMDRKMNDDICRVIGVACVTNKVS